MKKILITITIILSFAVAKAQVNTAKTTDTASKSSGVTITTVDSTGKIFTAVEYEPTFKGGITAFYNFLRGNMHYPEKAKRNNIQGKVFISFVVEKDGSLTNIKVSKGVSEDLDAEALRVIKASPNWNPGTQNGKPVRVAYTMPLSFALQGE
jgi:periplasmic protein TonB